MRNQHCKRALALAALLALAAFPAAILATDTVLPATLSLIHVRDEGSASGSSAAYWRGDQILLTNCICFAGTSTNSARQGLDGVTVMLRVGNSDSAVTYTGTVANAVSGLYWCVVTCPTAGTVYVQCTISNVNSYTYGLKSLTATTKL